MEETTLDNHANTSIANADCSFAASSIAIMSSLFDRIAMRLPQLPARPTMVERFQVQSSTWRGHNAAGPAGMIVASSCYCPVRPIPSGLSALFRDLEGIWLPQVPNMAPPDLVTIMKQSASLQLEGHRTVSSMPRRRGCILRRCCCVEEVRHRVTAA